MQRGSQMKQAAQQITTQAIQQVNKKVIKSQAFRMKQCATMVDITSIGFCSIPQRFNPQLKFVAHCLLSRGFAA
jgi:hypothetical protein